jgi:hypothetical protein
MNFLLHLIGSPFATLLSHKSSPMKNSILCFILDMLVNVAYVVLTNNHPWMCRHCFPTTCTFLQSIKLKNQQFLSIFNLIANSTTYMGHFLFRTNIYFSPWKLNSPNISENLIEFPFLSTFFGTKNMNEITFGIELTTTMPKDETFGICF